MYNVGGYTLDNFATESFCELRADQDPRTYFKYMDVAIEGIVNPETRVKLVSKLYDDLMKKGFIDFDKIPLSKGDFTKYVHFKNLSDTIEVLTKLFKNVKTEEFKTTQKLYNMLISCRSDFEYGYKFDIELIKFSYNTLVLSLHRAIDISILSYIEYVKVRTNAATSNNILKKGANVALNYKFNKTVDYSPAATKERLLIMEGIDHVLKLYDKGEWTIMINSFKKGRNNWLGTIGQMAKATGLTTDYSGASSTELTAGGVAVVTVISLIVAILGLRKIVYVFYNTAYKIDESIKRNKQFLEYTMKNNVDQSVDAVIKQEHLLKFYDRLHDTIESKVFAENNKARKNLKETNRARFSIADIGPENISQAKVVEAPLPTQTTQVTGTPVSPAPSNGGDFSFF